MKKEITTTSRRDFMKTGILGAAALTTGWANVLGRRSDLVLRPYAHPVMPPIEWAYLSDVNGDPFPAPVDVTREGIVVPDSVDRPFAVNTKWYVEGFGYVWLAADNRGELYTAESLRNGTTGNLNVAFAESRVHRNAKVMDRYRQSGANFSAEVRSLHALSQELLEDALKAGSGEQAADLADKSLYYALWVGEKIEVENAKQAIARRQRRDDFFFGCETRHFTWAKSMGVEDLFPRVFNYATITHYVFDTWYEVFEPREGQYRWGSRDDIVDWLKQYDITIEGRPLFWFHPWVTPDWLTNKSFSELQQYVDRHVEALVGHYGDDVLHWEVVNEYHDWANVHELNPEQITEIVRQACEKTHEVNPKVSRLINNCCPYGDYAASGHAAHGPMDRPLRTPRQFIQDLVEAEVPFEVLGIQMYFPERDLSEIVRQIERFAAFGKPMYITEIGASSGPTRQDLLINRSEMPGPLYDWHRPWDEELQADWLEQTYTVFYSLPYIHNVCWYDFTDFRGFINNGGLVTEDTRPKLAFKRLRSLLDEWGQVLDVQVDAPRTPSLIDG